jgi:hypothetical protein
MTLDITILNLKPLIERHEYHIGWTDTSLEIPK